MGTISMEILNTLGAGIILLIAFGFTYIGFHMAMEKDKGEYIPLPWEKGGFLNKTYHKVFDKSKVKYFDGDNT